MKTIDGAEVKVGDTVFNWYTCEPATVGDIGINVPDCYYSTRRLAILRRLECIAESKRTILEKIRAARRELAEIVNHHEEFTAELAKESSKPTPAPRTREYKPAPMVLFVRQDSTL